MGLTPIVGLTRSVNPTEKEKKLSNKSCLKWAHNAWKNKCDSENLNITKKLVLNQFDSYPKIYTAKSFMKLEMKWINVNNKNKLKNNFFLKYIIRKQWIIGFKIMMAYYLVNCWTTEFVKHPIGIQAIFYCCTLSFESEVGQFFQFTSVEAEKLGIQGY